MPPPSSHQQSPAPVSSSSSLFGSPPSQVTFSFAQPTIRKPIRLVRAVQGGSSSSSSSINESMPPSRPLSTSKTYSLAKPGLFSASPINSNQKLLQKTPTATRRFQSRDETDLQTNLKEFAQRYPNHYLSNELSRVIVCNDYHYSTDYTRALFPIPDRLRRIRSRESSGGDTSSLTTSSNSSSDYLPRTVPNRSSASDDHSLRQAVSP